MYARMNKNMGNHVMRARTTMFVEAADGVRNMLDELCNTVEKSARTHIELIWAEIAHDYSTALLGGGPDIEANLRNDVSALLSKVDASFARAFLEDSGDDDDDYDEMEGFSVASADAL